MHWSGMFVPLLFGSTAREKQAIGIDQETSPRRAKAAGQETEERNNLFGKASDDDIFCGRGREEGVESFDLRMFEPADEDQASCEDRVRNILNSKTDGAFATRRLLGRLAQRMTFKMKDAWCWQKARCSDSNENLPAGYTYLAQLVAHDLVANLAPLPKPDSAVDGAQRDFRSERLILDTIYGGGPAAGSLPFARRERGGQQRIKLRLGRPYAPEAQNGRNFDCKNNRLPSFEAGILKDQPSRDVPRTACPFLNDSPGKGFTDALLADPRNDDNLILSQLTALFHELHNIVVDKLVPGDLLAADAGTKDLEVYRQFLLCRKVVAFVYRRIIVHDLLCRLLDSKIYERYLKDYQDALAGADDICPDELCENSYRVPVEFSHAVFRFAHAIVRNDYVLNEHQAKNAQPSVPPTTLDDIIIRTSSRNSNLTPLSCDWLVDWKYFFETGEVPPEALNLGRRIIPDVGGGGLASKRHFPNEHVPSSEEPRAPKGGLFYRDLIRGAEVRVRSVDGLIKCIPEADRRRSVILCNRTIRVSKLMRWLKGVRSVKYREGEAEAIAEDPPLFFFTLFEAAQDKQGKRLGILGSTIAAKVFFSALKHSADAIERDPVVQAAVERAFDSNVPQTMPQLIDFIRGAGGLQDVVCKPVPAQTTRRRS